MTFHLPPFETDEQKMRQIPLAREALLAQLKAAPHRVTRIFDTIPAVALDVSPEARRILEQSPLVAAIETDRASAPQ